MHQDVCIVLLYPGMFASLKLTHASLGGVQLAVWHSFHLGGIVIRRKLRALPPTVFTDQCNWTDALIVFGRCFSSSNVCSRSNRVRTVIAELVRIGGGRMCFLRGGGICVVVTLSRLGSRVGVYTNISVSVIWLVLTIEVGIILTHLVAI